MKRVFITGCFGFLAAALCDVLETDKNLEIFGIDLKKDFKTNRIQFFDVDITNREDLCRVVAEIKPDVTLHLAAISNVGFCWENQHLTYEVNFIGSANLMEAVSQFAANSRIILMSSAELYGNARAGAIDENAEISIKSPYSLSKFAMEKVGDFYMTSNDLDIIKIRSFNFIGPGQDKKFVASDFSSQIAGIEKGEREPVIRVGNLTAVRDFSDVRDIARYLQVIAEKGDRGGIYNLCSGNTHSIKQILDILLSFAKKKIEIQVDESKFRPVDNPIIAGDCSLIRKKFNLYPEYEIQQTLLDILNYWRAR